MHPPGPALRLGSTWKNRRRQEARECREQAAREEQSTSSAATPEPAAPATATSCRKTPGNSALKASPFLRGTADHRTGLLPAGNQIFLPSQPQFLNSAVATRKDGNPPSSGDAKKTRKTRPGNDGFCLRFHSQRASEEEDDEETVDTGKTI